MNYSYGSRVSSSKDVSKRIVEVLKFGNNSYGTITTPPPPTYPPPRSPCPCKEIRVYPILAYPLHLVALSNPQPLLTQANIKEIYGRF